MIPITREHTNYNYKAPTEWDVAKYGECIDLPVSKYGGVLYSYHQPNFWERIQILFGKPIRLCIRSETQPPVALDLGD